ncbi:MipA/OmpV family protein [Parendozoicomonas haliclonae]|uniref:MltA-interacting protein n=1 Tax=Parendozoicomonas haliclonae TaxID=1960125 RepID=A0A1X7AGL9_9GAMM|nr:MipA/OmpV family protein [Parendozoicomonas haliclonae]SMA38602.1 MltA-interacting protein precursor [Parendozoicomonas haliclonae]
MRAIWKALPLALAAGLSASAMAADSEYNAAVGIGLGYEDSAYKGMDSETKVIPFFLYERGNFFVKGFEAGYKVINNTSFDISVRARLAQEGYDASDSDFLEGMEDRDPAAELGLAATYATDMGKWTVAGWADMSDKHNGYALDMDWEKSFRINQNWSIAPQAGISLRNGQLNDYYYGVEKHEAKGTRTEYNAGSGAIFKAGLSATYVMDPNQMIRIGTTFKSYSDEIADSSIVEDDTSLQANLIYVYAF